MAEVAMMILDPAGRVLRVSEACVAMVAASPSEILGRPVRETGLAPRRLRIYRDLIAVLAERGEWHGEYETSARRGPRRRLAVSILRVVALGPEPRYVVHARDVGLAEEVGCVVAALRHEIGNPVNSIKMALLLLRWSLADLPCDRIEDYLDRTLQEVARVEKLLVALRTFQASLCGEPLSLSR